MVQLPPSKGGLEGSTCYITSTDILPTSRLVEIKANHPNLSTLSVDEALGRIETVSTHNSVKLCLILKTAIHQVREKLAKRGFPLRLLVIDSIDFVLTNYDTTETTAKTLFERSKDTTDVALLLHRLTSEHDLAIVIINGVHSVFTSNRSFINDQNDTIVYLDQARWFGRGDGISVDGPAEAALGLVWANQIGTRVMLTRTGRRKHISRNDGSKRRFIASTNDDSTTSSSLFLPAASSSLIEPENVDLEETVVIRQLSVVFSQFAPPVTVDYIITSSGIVSFHA